MTSAQQPGDGSPPHGQPGSATRPGRWEEPASVGSEVAPTARDSGRGRRGPLRTAGLMLCVVALATAMVILAARAFGWQGGPLLFLVALTPYVGLGCLLIGLGAAVFLRSWPVAGAGLGLFAVVAWWWVPAFVPDPPPQEPMALRVMTTNLRFGEADPGAIVAAVRRERVDLLSLQELTHEAVKRLEDAGLDDVLPHSAVRTGGGAIGTGIWSRYPLREPFDTDGLGFENVGATVVRPGGELTFLGVHPVAPPPWDGSATDRTLLPLLDLIEGLPGPAVVAGDFNATRDNVAVRALQSAGYVLASDSAGAGLLRTWPNDLWPLPPFVGIDHVITRDLPGARSVRALEVPGTDHLAVVAEF